MESWQRSTEAAGRSLVSIVVDHIFLCIKDAGLSLPPLLPFQKIAVAFNLLFYAPR